MDSLVLLLFCSLKNDIDGLVLLVSYFFILLCKNILLCLNMIMLFWVDANLQVIKFVTYGHSINNYVSFKL